MNTKLSSLVAILVVAVLMSSCKTGSDVISDRGIQKRKYTKGYYMAQKNRNDKVKSTDSEEVVVTKETSSDDVAAVRPEPAERVDSSSPSVEESLSLLESVEIEQGEASSKERATTRSKERLHEAAQPKRRTGPSTFKVKEPLAPTTALNLETSGYEVSDTDTLLLVILAILLPPLAVYLLKGIGTEFWISVLLTLLFWLPGIIYALYLILA